MRLGWVGLGGRVRARVRARVSGLVHAERGLRLERRPHLDIDIDIDIDIGDEIPLCMVAPQWGEGEGRSEGV